uniref:Uncharacterized protein n=1 Tax=Kalanchoe fedtschenkoi TaxID=63787 RepID=A0A7N0TNS2_KALFE
MMAILSSLSVAIFLAVLTLCLCHRLSYIFTPGPVMSRAVAELSPFLAAVMVLNGIAPVLTGVAVGCGWQAFVGYINIGCYITSSGYRWAASLGFALSTVLRDCAGMLAGILAQTVIFSWIILGTNWTKEVSFLSHV